MTAFGTLAASGKLPLGLAEEAVVAEFAEPAEGPAPHLKPCDAVVTAL